MRRPPPPKRRVPPPARRSAERLGPPTAPRVDGSPVGPLPGERRWVAVEDDEIDPFARNIQDHPDDGAEVSQGLLGEVYEVIERLQQDPVAQRAVHELKFASMTITRSGADIAAQLKEAVAYDFVKDWRLRGWIRNAIRMAEHVLKQED